MRDARYTLRALGVLPLPPLAGGAEMEVCEFTAKSSKKASANANWKNGKGEEKKPVATEQIFIPAGKEIEVNALLEGGALKLRGKMSGTSAIQIGTTEAAPENKILDFVGAESMTWTGGLTVQTKQTTTAQKILMGGFALKGELRTGGGKYKVEGELHVEAAVRLENAAANLLDIEFAAGTHQAHSWAFSKAVGTAATIRATGVTFNVTAAEFLVGWQFGAEITLEGEPNVTFTNTANVETEKDFNLHGTAYGTVTLTNCTKVTNMIAGSKVKKLKINNAGAAAGKGVRLAEGGKLVVSETLESNGSTSTPGRLESTKAAASAELEVTPEQQVGNGSTSGVMIVQDIAFKAGPTYLPGSTNTSGNSVVKPEPSFTVAFEAKPSGTTEKKFTATLEGTGVLGRKTSRAMPASITAAGTMGRNIFGYALHATLTPAGTLGRNIFNFGLRASVTPAGTLGRLTSRVMIASVSGAGAFGRNVSKNYAATVTFAGALGRNTTRKMAASVAPAATFFKQEIGHFVKVFTATVAPEGSFTWKMQRSMAATLIGAGTFLKNARLSFAASFSPQGKFGWIMRRSMGATLEPTGKIGRNTQRAMPAAVRPEGTLVRLLQRTMTAKLVPSGAFNRLIARPMKATLTPVGSLGRKISLRLGAVLAPIGRLVTSGGRGNEPGTVLLSDKATSVFMEDRAATSVSLEDYATDMAPSDGPTG